MNILIGADFVPTDTNEQYFINGDAECLLGEELCQLLKSADYRIFNLEVPLTDTATPISKCGPNLIAKTATVELFKRLHINLFTIANNHIMDQGINGYKSTVQTLNSSAINHVGCADCLHDAVKPYIFRIDGRIIGVYVCAEHEFSIATETSAGANPFNPLESPDHVLELKKQCDYVIVLYHGGKEHYRYPSPDLQKTCRKFIDKGADLVVCQHSHCIGCEEKYNGGTIVYGQGNFLFDYSKSEYWKTGLLIQIDEEFEVSYIPIMKEKNRVRKATESEAESILGEFDKRSELIKQPGLLEEKYERFADEMINNYLLEFLGKRHFLFKVANKLFGKYCVKWRIRNKYQRKNMLALQNFIECESHRELLLTGIKRYEK